MYLLSVAHNSKLMKELLFVSLLDNLTLRAQLCQQNVENTLFKTDLKYLQFISFGYHSSWGLAKMSIHNFVAKSALLSFFVSLKGMIKRAEKIRALFLS